MTKSSLDSIFSPSSIAVVGASDQPGSVGGAIFSNLRSAQFPGPLWAVNRKHATVKGEKAFAGLADLPEVPDLVIVSTPAATVPQLVREAGTLRVGGMIVISAGFREAGPDGRKLESDLLAVRREFPNLRFVGPNCLGVLRPASHLNASFSPVMPRPGRLTFLSQSGALCTAILDWSIEREIGFATCVSVGNMADVGMGDLIDYFADDAQTDALLLYIEGLDDAAHFLKAAKECSRKKPVIAYKAGRFAESSAAAASHTGAIASVDAVYDVAFRHAGVERVHSIEELFDCARLLVGQRRATGDRLAIVTNAGGPGVMASDAWLALGSPLARLTDATVKHLNDVLPTCWSHGNPIDVLGDATVERFELAVHAALHDDQVDALLVILTPQTMTDPVSIAKAVSDARRNTMKPIVTSWIGGQAVESGRAVLRAAEVPVYDFPEEAIHALNHLVSSGRMQQALNHDFSTKSGRSQSPTEDVIPRIDSELRGRWQIELEATNGLLGEVRSKQLLADFGVPIVKTEVAHSAEDAVAVAERLGFPIVLKILSPDISHKTDVGGVVLNIANAEGIRTSYANMMSLVRQRSPGARIEGVAVQQMLSAVRGVELLLGMTRDPQFGPVLLLGAGGVTAELQKDSVLELPPFDSHVIDRMLRKLRLYPLLEGYRGRPGVDMIQLRESIMNFGRLVQAMPELSVAEINPLLATADRVVALDARMISTGKRS